MDVVPSLFTDILHIVCTVSASEVSVTTNIFPLPTTSSIQATSQNGVSQEVKLVAASSSYYLFIFNPPGNKNKIRIPFLTAPQPRCGRGVFCFPPFPSQE
jgi:hypothetical protein